MFIIENLTNNELVLSDIRVQLPPRSRLDLSKVCEMKNVTRSQDLKRALHLRKIRIVQRIPEIDAPNNKQGDTSQSVVVIEHKSNLTEEKIATVVRQVMTEMNYNAPPIVQPPTVPATNIETILESGINKILQTVSSRIGTSQTQIEENSIIDEESLANMQTQALAKVASEIESTQSPSVRSVTIPSAKKLTELAEEL